jgi:DNA-binding GntR family transcriptional regulator
MNRRRGHSFWVDFIRREIYVWYTKMLKVAKDDIFETLKRRILTGELSSDTPLKERNLAEEFGISRTPVREALRQLVSEKLVRIVPNMGAFVGSFSWKDATEIFAVRKVLEAYAAQLATGRLMPAQIFYLEKVLKRSQTALKKGDASAYMKCDEDFHACLNENCGNQHLTEMIRNVIDKTKLIRLRRSLFQNEESIRLSLKEHKAILSCLIAKDSSGAGRLVWQHGQRFYAQILQIELPPAIVQET